MDLRDNELLDKLVAFEQTINYRAFATKGELEFSIKNGQIPVLVSAPHSAIHTRNGEDKEEDEFTGALGIMLAEMAGSYLIYGTNKSKTDPNKEQNVSYKKKILEICSRNGIKFVLDIHGASADKKFGLALGTMHGRSCPQEKLEAIISVLQHYGFSRSNTETLFAIDIDNRFPAASTETVTKYVWDELHIPAMQLEVNASLRIVRRRPDASQPSTFSGNKEAIIRTVLALRDIVVQMAA